MLVLLLTGVFSCRRACHYRADHGVPPCEITVPLDSMMRRYVADGEPGAILIVMRGDSIVFDHAYGLARLDSAERVTDSTTFNLSSASKIITAVAIMKLCEEGKLSLDDSLSKFFPEFPARYFDHISLRHVLAHSSGLPDLRPANPGEWSRYLSNHQTVFGFGRDYRLYGRENEHMQTFVNLDTIAYRPGESFSETDIAYVLVAPLIERVTGEYFDSWMKRNVFDPAGMTETFYYSPGLRKPRMAHGYRPADPAIRVQTFRSADGRWDEYDYQEAEYFLTKADRGVFTSARDFMRFIRAFRQDRLVSEQSRLAVVEPQIETNMPGMMYALSTYVDTTTAERPNRVFHLGHNGGFAVVQASWPDKNVQYLMVAARNDLPGDSIMESIESIIEGAGWIY